MRLVCILPIIFPRIPTYLIFCFSRSSQGPDWWQRRLVLWQFNFGIAPLFLFCFLALNHTMLTYLLPNTEMDIDTIKSSKKKQARVQKRNQKPRNSIVFQKRLSTAKKGPKRKWSAYRVRGNGLDYLTKWCGGEEEKKKKGVWESTITPAIHVHMVS